MKYSKTGYRRNSKDRKNPFNIIPSNRISMKNVDIPLFAISDTGDTRIMFPNEEHLFGGTRVVEIPMKKKGGKCFECGGTKMQDGGETPNQKVVRLARERAGANNWITSIPQEILNTEEGQGHEGYTCIGGVCQVLTDAGLMNSPIWSNTEFERKAKDFGFSNPVYGIDNLEPGDVIQWRQLANKSGKFYPSHGQIFLGWKEDGSAEVFDNFAKQIKTYPRERMMQVLSPSIGDKRDKESAQIIKLNPKNIKGMGLTPEQQSQLAQDVSISETPVSYSRKSGSGIPVTSPYYYLSRQNVRDDVKDKLLSYMNDKDLDKKLRETLLIDDSRLQNLKPLVYGIMGQESSFDTPKSFSAEMKYMMENANITPSLQRIANQFLETKNEYRPSLGPAQQQLENINKRTAERFGIKTDMDLTNLQKSYVAALQTLNDAERYTTNSINNGKRYELKDKDPFVRALYWNNNPYNIVGNSPKDEFDADEKAYQYALSKKPNIDLNPNSPDYEKNWSEINSLKSEWKNNNLLNIDKGSYPWKVLNQARDLVQDYKLEETATLPNVTVKGKKKDNTFIGPPELQIGGVLNLFNGRKRLKKEILNENAALKEVMSPENMNIITARGKQRRLLESLGHNPEYFDKDNNKNGILDNREEGYRGDITTDLGVVKNPHPGEFTTLINRKGLNRQQIKDLATNDFVSHSLHHSPNYRDLSKKLENQLLSKYSKEMINSNGGVDAYVRAIMSNDNSYQPYRTEMGHIDKNFLDGIRSYIKSGVLPNKQFGGNSGDIIEQKLMRMQLGGENDFTPLSMTNMVTNASGPSISQEKLNPSYLGQFKPMFVTNSLTREKSMIDPNNLYQPKTSSGLGIPPSYVNAVVGAFGKRRAQLRQEQQIQDQLANPFNSIPIVTKENKFLNEGMTVKQEGGEVEEDYEDEEFLFAEDEQEQQQQPIQTQEEEIEEQQQPEEEEDYFSILSLDDDDDEQEELETNEINYNSSTSYKESSSTNSSSISPVVPPISPSSESEVANEDEVYNYLISKGLPEHVAAGIVGNLIQESSLNLNALGDKGTAYGLAQWRGDRLRNLKDRSLKGQLDYLLLEAEQRGDLQRLLNSKTPEDAAYLFAKHYERPKTIDQSRISNARRLYNKFKK